MSQQRHRLIVFTLIPMILFSVLFSLAGSAQQATPQAIEDLPPTILVSEVSSWCVHDSDCDEAELEFIPGSGLYFDRVRLAPVTTDFGYISFGVPVGVAVTYWDYAGTIQTKSADEEIWIYAVEAIFTRVRDTST